MYFFLRIDFSRSITDSAQCFRANFLHHPPPRLTRIYIDCDHSGRNRKIIFGNTNRYGTVSIHFIQRFMRTRRIRIIILRINWRHTNGLYRASRSGFHPCAPPPSLTTATTTTDGRVLWNNNATFQFITYVYRWAYVCVCVCVRGRGGGWGRGVRMACVPVVIIIIIIFLNYSCVIYGARFGNWILPLARAKAAAAAARERFPSARSRGVSARFMCVRLYIYIYL